MYRCKNNPPPPYNVSHPYTFTIITLITNQAPPPPYPTRAALQIIRTQHFFARHNNIISLALLMGALRIINNHSFGNCAIRIFFSLRHLITSSVVSDYYCNWRVVVWAWSGRRFWVSTKAMDWWTRQDTHTATRHRWITWWIFGGYDGAGPPGDGDTKDESLLI